MTHMEKALSQYGIEEFRGEKDNPEVLKYFNEIGFDGTKLKDETAWCAAFANWVLKTSELEYSGKLNARSFLDVGEQVNVPKQGDLVILWRESKDSWKGHVGFFVNRVGNNIFILGGNQFNSVCVRPYSKDRLLGYRRVTNE